MSVATHLMTVEEFSSLHDPNDGTYLELHHGEVVRLTFPKRIHRDVQYRIYDPLKPLAADFGTVVFEFGFRALAEYELRAADVAVVRRERYAAVPLNGYLMGAPELTIEVESPSNTASELDEKEALCLANGCDEFWIVYPYRKVVRVSTGETVRRYGMGDSIPLSVLPGQQISVSDIFAGV